MKGKKQIINIIKGMKNRLILVTASVALIFIFLVGFGLLRSREIIEGATAIDLAGGCQFTIFSPPLQPFKTVTLDCPRVDSIRIWPLPIVHPWYEDWWEKSPNINFLET